MDELLIRGATLLDGSGAEPAGTIGNDGGERDAGDDHDRELHHVGANDGAQAAEHHGEPIDLDRRRSHVPSPRSTDR